MNRTLAHRRRARAHLGVLSAVWVTLVIPPSGTNAGAAGAPAPPRERWAGAWIDDPLDGTVHRAGPVEIVAHAAHPAGLRRVELLADGDVVDDASGGSGLLTLRWRWATPEAGRHVLVVQAIGDETIRSLPVVVITSSPPADGGSASVETLPPGSAPVSTTVPPVSTTAPVGSTTPVATTSSTTTLAAPTVVPTTTVAATTRPPATTTVPPTIVPTIGPTTTTATPTTIAVTTIATTTTTTAVPTTVPCGVGAPRPSSPADGASVATLSPALAWIYDGCPASSFEVVVSRDPGFARVEASGTVVESRWLVQPTLQDCTVYFWRVRAYAGRTIGEWSTTVSFATRVGRC